MKNLIPNLFQNTMMTILAISTYGAGAFLTFAIPYSIWFSIISL